MQFAKYIIIAALIGALDIEQVQAIRLRDDAAKAAEGAKVAAAAADITVEEKTKEVI